MENHVSKMVIRNNHTFFFYPHFNVLKIVKLFASFFETTNIMQTQGKKKLDFICRQTFVVPFIYYESLSSMMSILSKKHHNIILTTIQIHLEINILDTKPMPNIVKTRNHHYNVIKHNLQETNF
jgi:hypothetical protein